MADEMDIAGEYEQRERDKAIASTRNAAAVDTTGTGECLCCGEPVRHGRWCDVHCRNDWQARNGVK